MRGAIGAEKTRKPFINQPSNGSIDNLYVRPENVSINKRLENSCY